MLDVLIECFFESVYNCSFAIVPMILIEICVKVWRRFND